LTNGIIKKALHAPQSLNEPIEYGVSFSRGIKVDFNGLTMLYISGTASIDEKGKTYCPGNFLKQTERTFQNLTALMQSESADWHDVVMTRCYLKDMKKYYVKFNEFRNKFYKEKKINPFPASVCVESNLCRPELLVEIDATVILRSRKKRKAKRK